MTFTAHVVCPGPSLDADAVPWDRADDLFLAVNSAVRHVPEGQTYYLVANDPPAPGDLLYETCLPRLIELGRPSIVTVSKGADGWIGVVRARAPSMPLLTVVQDPDEPTAWMRDAVQLPSRPPDPNPTRVVRASMLTAIGFAACRGATEVMLYGCDLADDGDAWYADPEVTAIQKKLMGVREPDHDYTKMALARRERRWVDERAALLQVISAARSHGISITRV